MTPADRADGILGALGIPPHPVLRFGIIKEIEEALDVQREKIAAYVDLCGTVQSNIRLNEALHGLAEFIRDKADERPV